MSDFEIRYYSSSHDSEGIPHPTEPTGVTFRSLMPTRFIEDRLFDREQPCGEVTPYGARRYEVNLDLATATDMLADAEYYSGSVRLMGPDYMGIQTSARATAKRLRDGIEAIEAEGSTQ